MVLRPVFFIKAGSDAEGGAGSIQKKGVNNVTALEYIYRRLEVDFPKEAEKLKKLMSQQMRSLGADEVPSAEWSREELATQSQLNAFVYPFLTCVKALVGQGTELVLASSYASRLWAEMPEEIRQRVDEEHLETMQKLFQSGKE